MCFFRSFVCNTKRPVKQSIKQQVNSNLADKPSLADGPPCLLARLVALNTSENSCLEYQ